MVYNQDNEPLTIFDFKGYYPISYLIFKSDITSEIFLYYNNPDAYAPQYDIEMVANEFLNAEKGTGILGKAEKLISTSSFDFTITGKNSGKLFWIALLSVVAVLIIIIRKLLPGGKNES
ncbi:hypothetical protein HY745_04715 [Candidatus Desantisbacteria bacterium]|nr:hypothetical protein [Candidatus Desantisbacteria bacterium]